MPQVMPAPVVVPRPRTRPDRKSEPLPLRLGLIFQAGVVTERLAPKLGVALVYGIEALLDRDELFAPALRVSLYRMRSGEITTDFGQKARFEWTAARLGACPVLWSWQSLGLRPCLIADLGSVTAEGYATVEPAKETLFWAALGAAVRGEALFSDTFLLEIEAGALFPLNNQSFYFEPSLDVYQIGPGVYALGGIGIRFL